MNLVGISPLVARVLLGAGLAAACSNGGSTASSDTSTQATNTSGSETTGGAATTGTTSLTSGGAGGSSATTSSATITSSSTGGANTGGTSGVGGSSGAGGSADCQEFVMPDDCTIPEGAVLPAELRCTGLYGDWETRQLACGVKEYMPAYQLWTDAAVKRRFFSLPPGETVDVTDPDAFQYPVGTRFWKEFHIQTDDGTRLGETRLMERVAAGWIYTSYVWDWEETQAVQQNEGVLDWEGTGHTIPSREQCKGCHAGRGDFILGWDALMLGAGATGTNRDDLVDLGLLTWQDQDTGAPSPLALEVPGNATEQAALGYLHANCGVSCHNDTSRALALDTGLVLRLDHDALGSVLETPAWTTALDKTPSPNAPLSTLDPPTSGDYVDLAPLEPERSLMLVRMTYRYDDAAMPPMGTNVVDDAGVELVRAWIEAMTPENGYPAQ